MHIKPIKTKAGYESALTEIDRLMGAKPGTPEGDRLDVLTTLAEAWEEKHHQIEGPNPIEATLSTSMVSVTFDGFQSREPGTRTEKAYACTRAMPMTVPGARPAQVIAPGRGSTGNNNLTTGHRKLCAKEESFSKRHG